MSRRRHKKYGEKKTRVSNKRIQGPVFPRWNKGVKIALLGIVLCSIVLNITGINWGQPSGHPWHSDSIAGLRTVQHMPNLFGQWKNKYPRVPFLVNAVFYKPLLNNWEKNPVTISTEDGRYVRNVLNIERVSKLIIISRVISAIMGVGSVVAVFMAARLLFRDNIAAVFSGLALAFTMLFVFYSHLGNVDSCSVFCFAWSLYWTVKAVYVGKWRHFALSGLFCALAVCSKDPMGGFVAGLGLAMWIAGAGVVREQGGNFRKALFSVVNAKVLVAILVAAICFAILNGLFAGPEELKNRMQMWKGVPARENAPDNPQLLVLQRSLSNLYLGLGWPFLSFSFGSLIYCAIRHRWKFAFGIFPLLFFYLIVLMNIRFVTPRFLLGGYPCLALLIGKGCSDLLRWQKLPVIVRVAPVASVYALSLLYCIGLDLELVQESRYKAERWLASRVDSKDTVVALCLPAYAPRMQKLGSRYSFCRARPKDDKLLRRIATYADYLILTEKEFSMRRAFDPNFLNELLSGSKDYDEATRFSNKYLYPKRTIFGLAGWPLERLTLISPEVIILKKKNEF